MYLVTQSDIFSKTHYIHQKLTFKVRVQKFCFLLYPIIHNAYDHDITFLLFFFKQLIIILLFFQTLMRY